MCRPSRSPRVRRPAGRTLLVVSPDTHIRHGILEERPPLLEVFRPSGLSLSHQALAHAAADAERHGLTVPFLDALLASGVAIPPHVERHLRLHRFGLAEAGLRHKSLLLRIVDALATAGVIPILLKGYAFAVRYHREPLLRPASDVDILVQRDELPVVTTALQSLGLARYDDPDEEMEQYHHHIAFSGAAGLVEVHFRATSGLGLKEREEGLALEAIPFDLEGRQVRIPRPEDELVYLAVHAAQHLFLRLNWLYDLKLFLERTELDWARVSAIARQAGMIPAVYAALHAVDVTFGLAPTTNPAHYPRPALWQRKLIRRLFTAHHLVEGTLPAHKVSRWLVHAALAQGPVRMGRDALDAVRL